MTHAKRDLFRSILAALLVAAPLLLATASGVPGAPSSASSPAGHEVADLLVELGRSTYAAAEPVSASVFVHNGRAATLDLPSLDRIGTIYRLTEEGQLEPVLARRVDALETGVFAVEPGATALLEGEAVVWDQRLLDGSLAPAGVYAYAVVLLPPAEPLAGIQVFGVGLPTLPAAAAAQVASALAGGAAEKEAGGLDATNGATGYSYARHWHSLPVSWYYNSAGEPSSVAGAVQSNTNSGMTTWENDGASYMDFTYAGTSSATVPNSGDSQYVVGWRGADYFGTSTALAVVVTSWFTSDPDHLIHADQAYNSQKPFSTNLASNTYDLLSVATHEAGHWINLGDLGDAANSQMTMYGSMGFQETIKRDLWWGDWSGVRYAYPERRTAASSIGDTTAEADALMWNFNGASTPDLLTAWVDDPAGGNTIYYRLGWDVSGTTGSPASSSATKTAVSGIGDATDGLGVAVGSIDATSAPDVVFAWIDDPAGDNTIYYKVGWNVNTAGDAASWSATKTAFSGVGWASQGLGACLVNLDATSRPELVLMWVDDPSGGNTAYYKVGWNIDTSGNAASWSATKTAVTGIGDSTAGAALTCTNIDESGSVDFVFAFVDNPSGDNYVHYHLGLNPNSSGDATWQARERAPGPGHGIGHETAGLGLASGEIDGQGIDELTFVFVDNPSGANSAYYRQEWNGRYMSH